MGLSASPGSPKRQPPIRPVDVEPGQRLLVRIGGNKIARVVVRRRLERQQQLSALGQHQTEGGSRYKGLTRYRRSQNRVSTPMVAATGTASMTPRKPNAAPPANSAKITHTAGSSTRSPRKR